MKNMKKKLLSIFVVMMLVLTLKYGQVFALDTSLYTVSEAEYTDEYKEYLKLTDEEREKITEPIKYKVTNGEESSNTRRIISKNTLLQIPLLLGNSLSSSFSLASADMIQNNVVVRNQGSTNTCWIFAMIGALESNLAMLNKTNNKPNLTYDFSERHMMYATSYAAFTNEDTNEYGYNKGPNEGSNYWAPLSYLTNGSGAIPETQMEFSEDTSNIPISEIQNKTISTTVEDVNFLNYDNNDVSVLKNKIKQFVSTYGGVYAPSHFEQDLLNWEHYKSATGAVYYGECAPNHAILIIGWDDNYSIDNFNSLHKPSSPGAWIIKNSWGDKEDTGGTLEQWRQLFINQGQINNNATTEDALEKLKELYGESKVSINQSNNHIIVELGNSGYFYISYEDPNIYGGAYLVGIEKSKDTKDYYKIYQHDLLFTNFRLTMTPSEASNHILLANVFSRQENENEVIDKISIFSPTEYTYKVYINPNNGNKAALGEARTLKNGTKEQTVKAGYHTIELEEPIQLTGEKFVIAVEVINGDNAEISCVLEKSQTIGTMEQFTTATVNAGESFWTLLSHKNNEEEWVDFKTYKNAQEDDLSGNVCLKAFTKQIEAPKTVSSIAVTNMPTKTTYTQNSNEELDLTGGIITVTYSDETTEDISMTNSNVTHSEFDISRAGMQTITLTYEGRTATFNISIQATQETPKTVTSIAVTNLPAKTSYTQNSNEELDLTGGVITVTYSDETTEEISMTNSSVTHSGFDISRAGAQTITLTYEGRTATFNISVQASQEPEPTKTVTSIAVKTKPTKTTYIQGEDEELDLTGGVITVTYSDETTEDINMTNSGVTYTGFDISRTGEQTITLTYEGRTATFKVTLQEPEKQPKSSDFGDAEAAITKAKLYMYSSSDKETKYEINIEISGAKIGDSEDTYTYYYYLSPSENKTNIKDNEWTKINAKNITKNNDGTFSINLEINITDLENYSDFENAESLYVYVKEVASINNENVTKINVLEIDVEDIGEEELEELLEFYVDDNYVGNMEDLARYIEEEFNKEEPKQSEAKEEQKEDDTTKRETLPAAGVLSVLSIIVVIGMLATIQYLKYRNIDR